MQQTEQITMTLLGWGRKVLLLAIITVFIVLLTAMPRRPETRGGGGEGSYKTWLRYPRVGLSPE